MPMQKSSRPESKKETEPEDPDSVCRKLAALDVVTKHHAYLFPDAKMKGLPHAAAQAASFDAEVEHIVHGDLQYAFKRWESKSQDFSAQPRTIMGFTYCQVPSDHIATYVVSLLTAAGYECTAKEDGSQFTVNVCVPKELCKYAQGNVQGFAGGSKTVDYAKQYDYYGRDFKSPKHLRQYG